jgi:hypothetical protein
MSISQRETRPQSAAVAAGATPKTIRSTMAASLGARLSALEAKLGVSSSSSSSSIQTQNDMSSRLDAVQSSMESQTTSQFRDTWNESQKLFVDLDPGVGLTHQQQPLLYRRQEVLAAAPSLDKDMQEMHTILHLLLTSQPANANNKGTSLREDQVTQAPILTSMQVSPEDQRRLDTLRLTMEDLDDRTKKVMGKMDHVLECYHAVMTAASEKCILADEAISAREG